MFVRYIAHTDETSLGLDALAYCDILASGPMPVRLVSSRVAEFDGRSAWTRHASLTLTPMVGGFVNAVCADIARWESFFTLGVKNVLLLSDAHLSSSSVMPVLDIAMRQYDAAYTLTEQAASLVERALGRRPLLASAGMALER